MTEKLDKRGKQSGIIIVSSIAAQFAAPGNFIYGCTKVFGKYLGMATAWENSVFGKKIDVMTLQPHFVNTKLIKQAVEKGQAFGVVSVTDCVNGALRDLGHEVTTYGPTLHEHIGCALTFMMKALPSEDKH